ncbi:hypothetical protein ACQP1O_30305 [Nocardia sp. CA-151230]|uniref:hypothetical protein n=1 Tax=Nocardia sp. CA-151230 TaxID=3239982 RepID=UPI003D8D487A
MQESRFGRYGLLGELGAGGMGQVYRAYDTGTHRVVALKVLPPALAHDPVYRERFRREAQATARLNGPPTTSPPVTSAPVTSGPVAPTVLEDFIRQHYSLLPGNPMVAWTRLTARYQGTIGGYDAYRTFWGTVGSVTAWDVSADPAQLTVTYRLTLRYGDGRSGTELRRAQLVPVGDSYLIDSAELVS